MTRYERFLKEKQKENPDFFESIYNVGAIDGKPDLCDNVGCDKCDFDFNDCCTESCRWLREEVEE